MRNVNANAAIAAWAGLGLLAYLGLPWYALQDSNGLGSIGRVFAAEDAANGLMQATVYGRAWLWLGVLGLALCAGAAAMKPSRTQGTVMVWCGAFGALGLAASGFSIGAKGWSFAWLQALFGELGRNQFGVGWGGFVALVSLVVLVAFGLARQGRFKGDLFISAAVLTCGTLLAVFILFRCSRP